MAGNILSYPCLSDSPSLLVNIINPLTNKPQIFPMLVDSGASKTCFPAERANFLGHNNQDARVKPTIVKGVGGNSPAFIHTLQIELIDPTGKIWRKLISPWKSSVMPVFFVEKMDTESGVLGRDVLSQWKSTKFRPPLHNTPKEWWVDIEL